MCFSEAFLEEGADVVVHASDIRLVHDHTFPGEVAGVINGDTLIFWMTGPILIEDQKKLLCPTKCEDRHQDTAPSVEDRGYGAHEGGFSLCARHVRGDAEGGFRNEDVDGDVGRDACGDEMSVVFPRVISREEDVQPGNLDHVHASSEGVAGGVRGDSYAADGVGGVIVYGFNQGECSEVIGFGIELSGKI